MSGPRLDLQLQPGVLRWARVRAGLDVDEIAKKLRVKTEQVIEWERSGAISHLKANKLARHTHTPLGFLFLDEPPEERLPIHDFRPSRGGPPQRPSPDLLETVQTMQRRVAWMREELIEEGADPLPFVGAWPVGSPPRQVAAAMRAILGLGPGWARRETRWSDALRRLRERIEEARVMVVMNGVVNNNTYRRLNVDEFRGFAVVDEYAPLVFVNSADFVSAQTFTLAHELAHVFAGASGVSDVDVSQSSPDQTEQFCNAVAAEFLVPAEEFRTVWADVGHTREPFQVCARHFKVSTLVVARRALELSLIQRDAFFAFKESYPEVERKQQPRGDGGGHFWNTQNVRVGKTFGTAVARAVQEGRLLYRDAYSLTGMKGKTFDTFVRQMGAHL